MQLGKKGGKLEEGWEGGEGGSVVGENSKSALRKS